MALIFVVLALLNIARVFGQVTCTCGSSQEKWQCTNDDGDEYQGGQAGYADCVEERDDIWNDIVDCKYCYKCVGDAGLGECECDIPENCNSTFVVAGIILIILGIIFFIWQAIVLYKFFEADGECKDVFRLCGCFVLGIVCIILGITMLVAQSWWYGVFS